MDGGTGTGRLCSPQFLFMRAIADRLHAEIAAQDCCMRVCVAVAGRLWQRIACRPTITTRKRARRYGSSGGGKRGEEGSEKSRGSRDKSLRGASLSKLRT